MAVADRSASLSVLICVREFVLCLESDGSGSEQEEGL